LSPASARPWFKPVPGARDPPEFADVNRFSNEIGPVADETGAARARRDISRAASSLDLDALWAF